MLQAEFAEGWRYVPLLMLVASFGVISIFFESFYQALKNSGVLMASTALGAGVNVVLGVALVPFMGPWGAGLAERWHTCLSWWYGQETSGAASTCR